MPKAQLLKRCPSCPPEHAWQPLTNFHKDRHTADGLYGYCKACTLARRRAAYNPEKALAYRQAHAEQTRERRREYMRNYMRKWRSMKSVYNDRT
jgi:hypothetical protein